MYSYIKGKLVSQALGSVLVETGGIGYKVFIPVNIYGKLPENGKEIVFYVSFVIRETFQALYGFLRAAERDLFEDLTTVSGIGPKIALSLIGHMSLEDFYSAIGNGDIQAINKVPGIGKKIAERLLLEMRDKISKTSKLLSPEFAEGNPHAQKISDAINALMNLGYNQATAHKAINKSFKSLSPDGIELPILITEALKNV
jgi:Holliday junction DNA helicase RuvA